MTSMSNVSLISMEPANAVLSGTRLMARALDALALANVEILVVYQFQLSPKLLLSRPKQDVRPGLRLLKTTCRWNCCTAT